LFVELISNIKQFDLAKIGEKGEEKLMREDGTNDDEGKKLRDTLF
jgi:hypothetical protein